MPALSASILLLPFIFQSATFKQDYVEVEISGFVSLSVYVATRIAELATIVYLAMTVRELRLSQTREANTPEARSRHSIVLGLTSIATVAAIARLVGSVSDNHTVSVLIPITIILFGFVGLYCLSHRHPWLMNLGVRASRFRPVTEEGKNRLERYREQLRATRWHLDPDIKIQQLARRLEIPVHDLSELINRESGANFNSFINALRIEHAKQLLMSSKDQTMLDIALASGFNSTSAFYAQFKRFESVPPAKYRDLVLATSIESGS
ncbi:MAG: helix-turn-helix domain-containing protein [Granulosicoccus sp.]